MFPTLIIYTKQKLSWKSLFPAHKRPLWEWPLDGQTR